MPLVWCSLTPKNVGVKSAFLDTQRALVDSGRAINVDQHSGWTAGFGAAPAG